MGVFVRKGVVIGLGVLVVFYAIGSLVPQPHSNRPTTSASASATPTRTPSESPKPTPKPTKTKSTPVYVPELIVDDLGEDNCTKFDTCTFVDIVAVKTCKNAQIDIDLFDDNDEDYDSESVSIGTIYKGAHLHNIEVGTDDPDAAYVEQSDFSCD